MTLLKYMQKIIDIFRFDEDFEKKTYSDFTVIVYRLDGEVDLHGFCGKPELRKRKQLLNYLHEKGVTHVNFSRRGRLVRFAVRPVIE